MYNTHLTPFGKFCQDLQEERHETSRQMAKKLEISSAFLCYVKHGQKKPTRRMLYNLIEAYHLHDDKKNKRPFKPITIPFTQSFRPSRTSAATNGNC